MKELNFSFPIVKDIEATRARHQNTMHKIEWRPSFLKGLTVDDLYESIMHANYQLFMHYAAYHWSNQKGVKALKTLVNNHVRNLILGYLNDNDMPRSWDTAYYLLHQSAIDKMMEAVTKLLHAELIPMKAEA